MNNQQILPNPFHLSAREIDVLLLVCDGLNHFEIGDKLCISHRTVNTHSKNCYLKFDIPSRQALLVKKAIQFGYYKIE